MKKKHLTNTEKAKCGIEYIKKIYKEKKGKKLVPPSKKEYGFDLKTPDEKEFIELKVGASGTPQTRDFYITKREFEKAKKCIKNGITYNFIIVYKIESGFPYCRKLPAEYVIPKTKPTMQQKVYIKAGEIENFKDL